MVEQGMSSTWLTWIAAGVVYIQRRVGNDMDARYRIRREVNAFRALLAGKEGVSWRRNLGDLSKLEKLDLSQRRFPAGGDSWGRFLVPEGGGVVLSWLIVLRHGHLIGGRGGHSDRR